MKNSLLIAFAICLLCACKPQVPGKYIQPGDMEDILYDYHLAEAMLASGGDRSNQGYTHELYLNGVLKKHDVTRAQFDSSMVYYTRHADRLHSIYENLAKRLTDEALALGASSGEIQKYGGTIAEGDTTDIWNRDRSCVLMPAEPYNVVSYAMPADTAFHKGDRMVLSFYAQFLTQDMQRDGVITLAMRLGNDSIVSQTIHVSSNSHYSLTVSDFTQKGIKDIRGFFYLNARPGSSNATLLCISGIKLVRMHNSASPAVKPEATEANGDSASHGNKPRPSMAEPDGRPALGSKIIAAPKRNFGKKPIHL